MFVHNGLFYESVSEGHPDKLADRIGRYPDEFLRLEPFVGSPVKLCWPTSACWLLANSRPSVSTHSGPCVSALSPLWPTCCGMLVIAMGRPVLIRSAARSRCASMRSLPTSTRELDRQDGIIGAGDQGLMFGYACNETPELMPAPIQFAHRLVRRQAELRRSCNQPWLGPDAKSQVTFRYEEWQARGGRGRSALNPARRGDRHRGAPCGGESRDH